MNNATQHSKILALDLGTRTGWAMLDPDVGVESGVENFSVGRGESPGMRFLRFSRWLGDVMFSGQGGEDRAWAAGFYDGEGSSGTYQAYKREHVCKDGSVSTYRSDNINMQLNQAGSPELLERFMAVVGGAGSVTGPYQDKRRPHAQELWWWKLRGLDNCREVISMLWPWLGSIKRKQALKALDIKITQMSRIPKLNPGRGVIVYELPHHRGGAATEILAGFSTRVQEFCARHGIEHGCVHTGTLKKFATGKGNASKEEMIAAAKGRWPEQGVSDDNQADALCVLLWGMENFAS